MDVPFFFGQLLINAVTGNVDNRGSAKDKNQSKMKSVAILVGMCAVFDFCFGYFRTHSLLGGSVWIVLGLGSTALLVWLYYNRL